MTDEVPNFFDLKVVETASLTQCLAALKKINKSLSEEEKEKRFKELLEKESLNE